MASARARLAASENEFTNEKQTVENLPWLGGVASGVGVGGWGVGGGYSCARQFACRASDVAELLIGWLASMAFIGSFCQNLHI